MSSINYFKEVSSDWDTMSNNFFGDAPRNSIYAQVEWHEVANVADIGCGAGYLTEGLIDRDLHITAIDQSPEMLEVMKSKIGEKKITYKVGDAETLPVPNDKMNLVMANMYLHHVENPLEAIREMYRILKPGGQLIFTDLDKHDNHFLVTEQHDKWMGFERGDVKDWMSEVGFKEVITDCVGSECCASSCNEDAQAKISIFITKGVK